MKRLITTICAVFVFCFVLSGTAVQAAAEYQGTLSKDYRMSWSNGTNKVYLNKATTRLYVKNLKTGKVKLLQKLKVDKESDMFYDVANVYGNNVYLNRTQGAGDSNVYVCNMKTQKMKCVKKNFNIQSATGKYMIAATYLPTDITPYPTWIYQITSKGLQKVKKLGTDTSGTRIVGEKVYYATYPEGRAHMNKMNVYRCDRNGKNNKLLFTQNVDDENGYIIPEEFTAKKITFAVSSEKLSGSEEDPVIEYVYDCATKQITKVEK